MKKKIIYIPLFLIVIVIGYIAITYYPYISYRPSGGGAIQTAPDQVRTGEPITILLNLSKWGNDNLIEGRYSGISLSYRISGERKYLTIKPERYAIKDNIESYVFTIPSYPEGIIGSVEYYIELMFDGHYNRIDGIKEIRVIE